MKLISTALACGAGLSMSFVPLFALLAIWGGDERWGHTAATMFFIALLLGVASLATSESV